MSSDSCVYKRKPVFSRECRAHREQMKSPKYFKVYSVQLDFFLYFLRCCLYYNPLMAMTSPENHDSLFPFIMQEYPCVICVPSQAKNAALPDEGVRYGRAFFVFYLSLFSRNLQLAFIQAYLYLDILYVHVVQ